MEYTPSELEAFVRQRAPEIVQEIEVAAAGSHHEADLVAAMERILERFAKNFDVTLHHERERTLINGRADAVYNRFVIEYEPPRSLRREKGARTNQHAVDQVRQYMDEMERVDRQRKERLAGVAMDGSYLIFVRYRDEHWHVDDPQKLSAHSIETFLRYLLSLSTELALTPENLQRDFGENSNVARVVMPALYRALGATDSPKVGVLFQQWQRQFSEITGYERGSSQLDLTGLARSYAIADRHPDGPRLFFALHTYYATFIKLLAVQVAQYYLMPKMGTSLAAEASRESRAFRQYLLKMERGGVLADFGIKNFVEGDFFGWYLDIWDEALEAALRRLVGDLANYSLVTLDVDPEETRDLLKQLYQNLMPRPLRHALGEYYTPDWLAERVLNQLGYQGDPGVRLLDPACGSGTFLVLAIKRVRAYAEDKMLPPANVLKQVLTNIVGFDLNPLAVISARANYLLALGDLLQARKEDISIPVYLADSILTPSLAVESDGQGRMFAERSTEVQHPGYSFQTAVGRFTVPVALVTAERIDGFAELLENAVHSQNDSDVFEERLRSQWPDLPADQTRVARDLFAQLADLESQGINGIWARIIKNAFAPLFQRRFDLVAGNPPWVNWESLPEDYRQQTAPLWATHELFPHKGYDAILGKAKDDISVLMTYVALDQYLRPEGKLGFVITQSVFKTAGAGKGFRRFRLGDGTRLNVLQVDDMSRLKPFAGASNRTAVVIMQRGWPMRYPLLGYNLWYKPGGGAGIAEDLDLAEIVGNRIAALRQHAARPVDRGDSTSAWITGRPRALEALDRVLGQSMYRARAGVCTWLNGVYYLDVLERRSDGLLRVQNIIASTKRRVDQVQTALEPDLIYPLLKMRDLDRWSAVPAIYILLPHLEDAGLSAISVHDMQLRYPRTYSYLDQYKDVLLSRSGYGRYFRDSAPFYSVFDVGQYTFSPWKVVWPNIASSVRAAVVSTHDDKIVVPENVVTLVPVAAEPEAYYLCGVMNSAPVDFAVQSYAQRGGKGFASPHVLENVAVPVFDSDLDLHRSMSDLSIAAHEATSAGDLTQVRQIEAEIDGLAARLWGLSDDELREIQASLVELA